MRGPEDRIGRIARGQHGLLTHAQLAEAGVATGQLRGWVERGLVVRVRRGVYRLPGAPRTWSQRALEGCLAAGAGAVLWGPSAAQAWGLDVPPAARVEVAVRKRAGWVEPTADLVVHRVHPLESRDRALVAGLPVTTVPRTVVDLAGCLAPAALERAIDDALSRRLTSPDLVRRVAERTGTSGRRGAASLRTVLAPWLAGAAFDSVAEADCQRLLQASGLPEPLRQYPVLRDDGLPAVLDFAWPAQLVALEVDGFRWHARARAHARDSFRSNNLVAAGWTVLRATPTELAEHPQAVLRALARLLGVGSGRAAV